MVREIRQQDAGISSSKNPPGRNVQSEALIGKEKRGEGWKKGVILWMQEVILPEHSKRQQTRARSFFSKQLPLRSTQFRWHLEFSSSRVFCYKRLQLRSPRKIARDHGNGDKTEKVLFLLLLTTRLVLSRRFRNEIFPTVLDFSRKSERYLPLENSYSLFFVRTVALLLRIYSINLRISRKFLRKGFFKEKLLQCYSTDLKISESDHLKTRVFGHLQI